MNRLPRLTAADEPTRLASVTAAITSPFSPAWWPCSAVTVIVVVTIPAGHIRQSSSPASSARLRASACTRNTARTFCTSIATAAQTGDTADSVRLRSGRRLASERKDRCQHRLLRTHPLMRRRLAPVAATATSGGSHHAATPAVCSSQVTASAAATAAATVQSSPMTNPYQNFPKATSPRRLTVPARLSQETVMVSPHVQGSELAGMPGLPPQPPDVPGGGEDVPGGQGDDEQVCAGPRDPEPLGRPEGAEGGQQYADQELQGAARDALHEPAGQRAGAADDHQGGGRGQGRGGERPRGRAEGGHDDRDFQALEPDTPERQEERDPVHAVGGDVVVGGVPRAHAAQAVGGDPADPLAEPLQAEHEQQRAGRQPQRVDRHERQRRAQRRDERRDDGQAGAGAQQGRAPAADGADADHDDHHLDDLDGRGEERGGEDCGVDHGDVAPYRRGSRWSGSACCRRRRLAVLAAWAAMSWLIDCRFSVSGASALRPACWLREAQACCSASSRSLMIFQAASWWGSTKMAGRAT